MPEKQDATAVKKEEGGTDSAPSTTQVVQRAVNIARRADQRYKKAIQELDGCRSKWASYQKQMRELYLRQQELFQKDVDHLEAEVLKHQDAAELAEIKLKEVLAQGGANPVEDATMAQAVIEDSDPWADLIANEPPAEQVAAEDARMARELQRLLSRRGLAGQKVHVTGEVQAGPASPAAGPMAATPQTRTSGGLPVTPIKASELSRASNGDKGSAMQPFYSANVMKPAAVDPYQLSPTTTQLLAMGGGAGTGGQSQSPLPKSLHTRSGKRVPIKEVGRQPTPRPSGTGEAREAHLQSKREQTMQSLISLPQHIAIFDDDDEDLTAPPDGGTASALTGME